MTSRRQWGRRLALLAIAAVMLPLAWRAALADEPKLPKGVSAFGQDKTIADIGRMEWQPLKLEGMPPGIEIAPLRGDLAKGGGEVLLRLPPNYTVSNHSHTSDELYVWLKGSFTYIAADGTQQDLDPPAYISLPGNTPHAIKCHSEPCILYVKYGRPFDLHVHPMPAAKSR